MPFGATVAGFGGTGMGYQVNGTASIAGDVLQLTADLGGQVGSSFNLTRVPTGAFTASFRYNATAAGTPADGMTFVLHNDPRGAATIGWGGANLGLMSIVNGLGIAFDTYQNADRGDIVNDSASFVDTDALTQTARIDLGNVEDGAYKTIVVSWNVATHTFSYSLNGVTIGTITIALRCAIRATSAALRRAHSISAMALLRQAHLGRHTRADTALLHSRRSGNAARARSWLTASAAAPWARPAISGAACRARHSWC